MSGESNPLRLMVLLFSDIVGSVRLKGDIGTEAYSRLLARHDEIFNLIIARFEGARVLQDTGDGYFATFATTSDAVHAALLFQHAIATEPWGPAPIRVRVGVNIGEVAQVESPGGAPKLVGMAVDLTSRVTSLAQGSQILLTRFAFNEARQFVSRHPDLPGAGPAPELRWVAHGPYLFKGSDERIEVYEVGAVGIAPLAAPPDVDKARRAVTADEEQMLGWRPAVGSEVPGKPGWVLERRVGEGGFGEVWLASHRHLEQRRVFKFCFDAEKLRSLKREMTLFRLIRKALGERDDIARLHEVRLDKPPYFLESDYAEGGSLDQWLESVGGFAEVPMPTRLDLVARVADAVAAAHSVGVLHKDIKPTNILIYEDGGQPRPRLADFGIGAVTSAALLEQRNITVTGMTAVDDQDSSRMRTAMYAPPELLAGHSSRPFTMQGDVYSLGVLLFQLAVADLERPLAVGWERDVEDELLRQDIAACVDGNPDRRLGSAAELARRLRGLEARRGQRDREEQVRRHAARRKQVARLAGASVAVLVALLGVAGWGYLRENRARLDAQYARDNAAAVVDFLRHMFGGADPTRTVRLNVTAVQVLDDAAARAEKELSARPEVLAEVHGALGQAYAGLGDYDKADTQLRKALDLRGRLGRGEDLAAAELMYHLAMVVFTRSSVMETHQAQGLMARALEIRAARLGPDHQLTGQARSELGHIKMVGENREEGEELWLESLRPYYQNKTTAEIRAHFATQVAQARFLWREGRRDAAIAMILREVDPMLRNAQTQDRIVLGMGGLARKILAAGDEYAAEAMGEAAVEAARRVKDPRAPLVAHTLAGLGHGLAQGGRVDDGVAKLREAVDIDRERLPPGNEATVWHTAALVRVLLDAGRRAEADEAAARLLKDVAGEQPRTRAQAHGEVAFAYVGHDAAHAAAGLSEALRLAREGVGPVHPTSLWCVVSYATALRAAGRPADARALCVETLGQMQQRRVDNPMMRALLLSRIGQACEELADVRGAEGAYRDAIESVKDVPGITPEPETLHGAARRLGLILAAQGRHAEAEPYLDLALDNARRAFGVESPEYESEVRDLLAAARRREPGGAQARRYAGRLARALRSRNKLAEAEAVLVEALKARDAAGGGGADDASGLELAETLLAAHRPREAEALARAELERWKTRFPDDAKRARAERLIQLISKGGAAQVAAAGPN